MDLTALASEQYVSLTTYRKNGESSSVPVWIADLGDGRVGFTTSGESLKAKRIANDSRVRLQPSNGRGVVKEGTEPVDATASLATGADFAPVLAAIKAKYGWKVGAVGFAYKVASFVKRESAPESDTGIVISASA